MEDIVRGVTDVDSRDRSVEEQTAVFRLTAAESDLGAAFGGRDVVLHPVLVVVLGVVVPCVGFPAVGYDVGRETGPFAGLETGSSWVVRGAAVQGLAGDAGELVDDVLHEAFDAGELDDVVACV